MLDAIKSAFALLIIAIMALVSLLLALICFLAPFVLIGVGLAIGVRAFRWIVGG